MGALRDNSEFTIPKGFIGLGLENQRVLQSHNLLSKAKRSIKEFLKNNIGQINSKISQESIDNFHRDRLREVIEASSNLKTLWHLQLKREGSAERDVVLIEDKQGKKAVVIVCRDTRIPSEKNPAYGQLEIIGGCGLYNTDEVIKNLNLGKSQNKTPLAAALIHTKFLNTVMARKCWMANLGLGGMKATIIGEMDWEASASLQIFTGWLFSKIGPFTNAISGTDARQTPVTIGRMAIGSEIGGDHQIAGTIKALDTPGSCRFSLEQTHLALKEKYGDKIPDWQDSIVLVEGFGRIGRTAIRLTLDKRAKKVMITDPLLTDEDYLLPGEFREDKEKLRQSKEFAGKNLQKLREQYGDDKIAVVKTNELEHQKGDIFIPCSTTEGNLTKEKLNHLAESGIRLILSGANGPFKKGDVWQLARYVHDKRIIIPPEILTNCGSVTAAAMEPLFRARLKERKINIDNRMKVEQEAKEFVDDTVIPHIERNSKKKLALLAQIIDGEGVDIYTAGEIAFKRAYQIPYEIENGILIEEK